MVIDRIKESPAGSAERTFNYLWSRLVRHIAEQQHDRNLTAIQEGLRKGPKKPGMTAKPDPKPDPKKEATGTNVSGAVGKGKSKGKKGGKGKSSNDTSKGKSASNSSSQNPKDSKDAINKDKGVCIFYPKGLCRRGTDCPYKHERPPSGSVAKPKGSVPTPKAKPGLVALVGSSLLGAVASHAPQVADVFSVEWALDSGAGEHLASKEALISQGIPSRLLEELETVSSSPLTFSTGGGLKEASLTIRSQGEVLGDGVIYMLKKCPFVNLFSRVSRFFGGPINHDPTLVPSHVGFSVESDSSKCIVADHVDHCVPVFRDEVSLTHGVPAMRPALLRIPIMMKSKSLNPNQVQHHIQAPKLLCRHPLN